MSVNDILRIRLSTSLPVVSVNAPLIHEIVTAVYDALFT